MICHTFPRYFLIFAGWVTHGNQTYYFSSQKKNFAQAQEICKTNDAHLLGIADQTEQHFITSKIR